MKRKGRKEKKRKEISEKIIHSQCGIQYNFYESCVFEYRNRF